MSSMSDFWMVRAGRNSVHVDLFLEESCMFVGWGEGLGDRAFGADRNELRAMIHELHPSRSKHKVLVAASQLYRFLNDIEVGDTVMTYDASQRRYLVGEVTGDAKRRDADSYARPVKWTKRVARDGITVGTRNSLGAILTVFRLNSDASRELASRCVAIDAGPDVAVAPTPAVPGTEEGTSVEDVVADALEKSREFVEDRIASLEAYEMQDLVAGILRALGYKTQVAGPGSDRGVDIFASPDGLGLEEPRIFVEVKHRPNSSMGTQEVRSFMGGRQQGDRCLFVSTGGFSREARYEAERSNVPLKLIGLPQLRELLVEHYEEVDAETKRLVPLVKTYWPVAEE